MDAVSIHTWVEISKSAIERNIHSFLSILPEKTALAAVVKSNAYGHDIKLISRLAIEAGVKVIAVNSPEEAILLHKLHPEIQILVMGVVMPLDHYITDLNAAQFIILVSNKEAILEISRKAPLAKIHLKTDTGMGRLGFHNQDLKEMLEILKQEKIVLHGIATHFASTEDFTEHSYSMAQLRLFQECIQSLAAEGFNNLTRHCASSASTMLFSDAHMDMVRIGISLYGLWPSLQTKLSLSLLGKKFLLEPALSWKTRIVHINSLPAGAFVGYGSTYKTTHPSRIAVLPVGYFEGLDRKLSNNGAVIIRGERARIVGRICMNMTMVDVTAISGVEIGDEVVIIGKDGNETISADDLAALTGTINYEVVTRIHESIVRIETV